MRLVDGPTMVVEVAVAASAERVWDLVVDIDLPARFSDEFRGAEWVDPGPALGARFVGRNHNEHLGGWQTTSTVDRFDPPRSFGWAVEDPANPSASWWFAIADDGDGVLLSQGVRLGPGPSGLTPVITAMPDKEERILTRRLADLRRNMEATLDGIRRLAESPVAAGGGG